MHSASGRRPSPALLVAVIALVAALAGSATALPGKNNVDKNDIKKNAVKSKAVKNGQIKSVDIADGGVAPADVQPAEAVHLVGAPGEPGFENGGDGDCIWAAAQPLAPSADLGEPGFYMDAYGRVHVSGLANPSNGPGGDAACGGADSTRDAVVFILPPAYRPADAQLLGIDSDSDVEAIVAGDVAFTLSGPGNEIPAGGVAVGATGAASLDGISFRAGGSTTANSKATGSSGADLEKLGIELGE